MGRNILPARRCIADCRGRSRAERMPLPSGRERGRDASGRTTIVPFPSIVHALAHATSGPRLGQNVPVMAWLAEYGLFLAKAVTVVAAIGLAVGFAAGAARRGRDGRKHRPSIEVTDLNREYRRMAAVFERAALPRKALRARRKADKAERKARARAGRIEPGDGRRRVFVLDFKGDLRASGVTALRDEVTTVLAVATAGDEVVVRLENAGGAAHAHGLGASQLARIRARGIPLTVAVDRIAASGGYMMACVADRILAAPFAIVGSIGVFAAIPNLHRLLEARGIDVEQFQAGEFKLTVTMLGKNTDAGRAKLQHQLDTIHQLFKDFVAEYRPALDVGRVSTGEFWHGREALALHLVDEIRTSDDHLYEASREADLYHIRGAERPGLRRRLTELAELTLDRLSFHAGG